jgi:hypothetical protein
MCFLEVRRAIQTGVGPVEVRRAKVRDRGDVGAEEKIRFTSSILPKWARRTRSLDALLPVLYLRGVSTGVRRHHADALGAAVERPAEMVSARRQLSDDKVAAENASRLFEDGALRHLYRGRIARLAADIALLDKRLGEIVAGDAMLARRYGARSRRGRAGRQRCRTAGAGCTGANHREHRRGIKMPSNKGAIQQKPCCGAELLRPFCGP